MLAVQLFFTFILVGAFSFGGGYAMISFIQNQVVNVHTWISNQEFIDMIAISQSTPGPIAVNTATYTGYKILGFPGAVIATVALMIPAFFIIITIYHLLKKNGEDPLMQNAIKGIKPMTVALIIGSSITLGFEAIVSWYDLFLALTALLLTSKFKANPILVIFIFGLLGIFTR